MNVFCIDTLPSIYSADKLRMFTKHTNANYANTMIRLFWCRHFCLGVCLYVLVRQCNVLRMFGWRQCVCVCVCLKRIRLKTN